MGKIAKGVYEINFTMLYGNYCCIIIENFPKIFSPCSVEKFWGVQCDSKIKYSQIVQVFRNFTGENSLGTRLDMREKIKSV